MDKAPHHNAKSANAYLKKDPVLTSARQVESMLTLLAYLRQAISSSFSKCSKLLLWACAVGLSSTVLAQDLFASESFKLRLDPSELNSALLALGYSHSPLSNTKSVTNTQVNTSIFRTIEGDISNRHNALDLVDRTYQQALESVTSVSQAVTLDHSADSSHAITLKHRTNQLSALQNSTITPTDYSYESQNHIDHILVERNDRYAHSHRQFNSNDADLADIMNEVLSSAKKERYLKSQFINAYLISAAESSEGEPLNPLDPRNPDLDQAINQYHEKLNRANPNKQISFISGTLNDVSGLPLSANRLRSLSISCLDQQAKACFLVAKHYDYLVDSLVNNRANNMTHAIAFYSRACGMEDKESCRIMARAYGRYGATFLIGEYHMDSSKHYGLKTPFDFPEAFPVRKPQEEIDHISTSKRSSIGNKGIRALALDNRLRLGIRYSSEGCRLEDPNACTNLGMVYMYGYGLKPDSNKAINYFNRACRLALVYKGKIVNNPSIGRGCYELGEVYLYGQSLPDGNHIRRDIVQGYNYLNSACSLNDDNACSKLKIFKLGHYSGFNHFNRGPDQRLTQLKFDEYDQAAYDLP